MTTATQNLLDITAALQANGKTVKITVLKTRGPRKGETPMSMTKGSRSNTNRRGQTTPSAVRATRSVVAGNVGSYFKTSG
jgi:hypothetical protein